MKIVQLMGHGGDERCGIYALSDDGRIFEMKYSAKRERSEWLQVCHPFVDCHGNEIDTQTNE